MLDPSVRFSVRDELDEIEPMMALDNAERGRVMQMRSFMDNKGGRMSARDPKPYECCGRSITPFRPAERIRFA